METKLRKYRPDIQGLRALAIGMVVIWHVGLLNLHGGVIVSFVLSGYLIGSQLLREVGETGKVALGKFWARRMRRLAPGMAIVIITTIVFSWLFASPLRFRQFATDGIFAVFSSLNWRLASNGTDYFASNGVQSPYQHFWSLGIEEQFYLVFPLLLIVVAWLSRRLLHNRSLVVGALVLIIGTSLYAAITQTQTNQPLAYFGSHTHAWELAAGILLAVCSPMFSRLNHVVAAIMSWVGLATIIVTGVLITDQTPLPGYAFIGTVVGTLMVIAGGCANSSYGAEWLLKRQLLNFVATVSYGWYLWHWPLLILWPDIVGREITFSDRFRIAGFSLFLATIMYYGIERHVRTNQRFTLVPRRGIALGTGLVTVAASALAVALVAPLNAPPATAANTTVPVGSVVGLGSVREALGLRGLPGNVRPSLLRAPQDLTGYGCIDQLRDRSFRLRSDCIMGKTYGRRTIVVFGDSHAWQWGDAFKQISLRHHVRIVTITKEGCSPEDYRIRNDQLDRAYTECSTWRESAMSAISQLHPKVIVVSGRVRREADKTGAARTFARLRATGAKLVYLADTPRPAVNIPDCLATHAANVSACSQRSDKAVQFPAVRSMEWAVAKQYGALTVDVLPAFCADRLCPPVIGGRIVYFDDSHITATYSRALVPLLKPTLLRALS